ncbi:MAG: phosphatidylserine decarboxylase [Puniceicoccaceae bacterium]|nr:MAG: phosphatidylserine decarboxylase [Puniceicoccaceae bacterium]
MSTREPIQYYHRYYGRVETEAIYGEAWLRWIYETATGRLLLRLAVARAWFSKWYGWRMSRPASRRLIRPFVAKYGLDAGEFAEPLEAYPTFNDFFYRRLRRGSRPIDPDPRSAVFAADGRHLGWPDAAAAGEVYVKGQRLDLARLLGDAAWAENHRRGALVISRLCPVDYHRFHFPVAGRPGPVRTLPGRLHSVSPIALRRRIDYLLENRRTFCRIDSEIFGNVLMLEIGATCVGSIRQTHREGEPCAKGGEKGYFAFGGSCVILLFEPGRLKPADDLVRETRAGRELYARMGDLLGVAAG